MITVGQPSWTLIITHRLPNLMVAHTTVAETIIIRVRKITRAKVITTTTTTSAATTVVEAAATTQATTTTMGSGQVVVVANTPTM